MTTRLHSPGPSPTSSPSPPAPGSSDSPSPSQAWPSDEGHEEHSDRKAAIDSSPTALSASAPTRPGQNITHVAGNETITPDVKVSSFSGDGSILETVMAGLTAAENECQQALVLIQTNNTSDAAHLNSSVASESRVKQFETRSEETQTDVREQDKASSRCLPDTAPTSIDRNGPFDFSINVSTGGVVINNDVTVSPTNKRSSKAAKAGLSLQLSNNNNNSGHNHYKSSRGSQEESIDLTELPLHRGHGDSGEGNVHSDSEGSDLESPSSAGSSTSSTFSYSPSPSSATGSVYSLAQPSDVQGASGRSGSRTKSHGGKDSKKKHTKSKKGKRRKSSVLSLGRMKKRLSLQTTIELEPGVFEKSLSPLGQVVSMWYVYVFFLTPILLLPVFLLNDTPESRCAYVIFVMAIYWVTEAVPIPVTSLIPIFILPMMGLVTARQASSQYINDTSVLFLGGLTVAIAIETWNLHRRIALAVMIIVGAEPRWLMLGMMLVTWFLSMWISNTATTAMMLPIVQAVIEQITPTGSSDATKTEAKVNGGEKTTELKVQGEQTTAKPETLVKNEERELHVQVEVVEEAEEPMQLSTQKLAKALSLAIAYSANVGGIGSLTGTGPNLVLLGQSQIVFEKVGLNTPVTFATWMVFGFPLSLILVFVVWIWLQILFLPCRGACACLFRKGGRKTQEKSQKVREAIRAEFQKLGPISFAEGTIIACFAILVVLWITRDLSGQGGWGVLFPEGYVSDSTPAVLIAVLMFILPSTWPDVLRPSRPGDSRLKRDVKPLLAWKDLHQKMPWSLYLLLGGGFALAKAATDSGLSVWLGSQLAVFGTLNPWVILLLICYIVTFFTEITSNTAIATLMMPILAQLSVTLKVNPLFFMFPVAITTSFAFMLPVATPPNAIVFAFGAVRVIDMVIAGFVLNLVTVPILILASVTWGNAFFDFQTLPPAFLTANASAIFNVTEI